MLGWVIACHDDKAQCILEQLEKRFGHIPQCRVVNYWKGIGTNMLSRMMCDALHHADSGDGVIFLTDCNGDAPYRVAALMSHKHDNCEVISGVSLNLLTELYPLRFCLSSRAFRHTIVERGGAGVSSLWHQQQKNPPFVLVHHS